MAVGLCLRLLRPGIEVECCLLCLLLLRFICNLCLVLFMLILNLSLMPGSKNIGQLVNQPVKEDLEVPKAMDNLFFYFQYSLCFHTKFFSVTEQDQTFQ